MIVALIVITTIVAFIVVDLVLRMTLKRITETRQLKEREQALEARLKLDVSEEAPSLKRVEALTKIAEASASRKKRRACA